MENKNQINFGIGFVTGRANVCNIINNYYSNMLEQIQRYNGNVKITIFILFDINYQGTKREDFYKLKPEVSENIEVKYITPEIIDEEISKLVSTNKISLEDITFFLGHGHAKGHNTVMYFALKEKIDYLLFWDDDEYPIACLKEKGYIEWQKQDNILKHIEFMNSEKADVTIGYHCGYISPIPYFEFTEEFTEDDMKNFIEAISNDIISWNSIKEKMENTNGVTYAKRDIANGMGQYEIESDGLGKWIAGSTLCLNMNNRDKIPAFYNPPFARGEDTFFSTLLDSAKVVKIPVYHFHDGFLKYTKIMNEEYPKILRKISIDEDNIKQRFLKASRGWIRYKPLLLFIKDSTTYKDKINQALIKLEKTIPQLNKLFQDDCFSILIDELVEYDKNVEKHYEDYRKTNQIWNFLKTII